MKNGDFPMKNCDLPMTNGDFMDFVNGKMIRMDKSPINFNWRFDWENHLELLRSSIAMFDCRRGLSGL